MDREKRIKRKKEKHEIEIKYNVTHLSVGPISNLVNQNLVK